MNETEHGPLDNDQTTGKEELVSIQSYIGDGYELPNGEETDKIAEAARAEIEAAVKEFFQVNYHTEIVLHNIVGNVDGATVFVESVGEPHFYTYAIVPMDVANKKVLADQIWTQEGEVERAIIAGLYAMIFEDELATLDNYFEQLTAEYPVVGFQEEAIENVMGSGYTTPYYFISIPRANFNTLYEMYQENREISKAALKNSIRSSYDPKQVTFSIQLFMKEANKEPDPQIFDQIIKDIEAMEGLPKGSYSVRLNDNYIDKATGNGVKENTLERAHPNEIIKQ
ncbi:DUF1672 domain-containing protein [Caldibacillus lycopersici]|uniref:DUF1672 domain-containing protein n=1 Tax=Perspicuibacillus lycopersici TaxID=1325689 RepID=A0AAE3LP59_9BACI|nr:DUF1672 domain-containing protein [Perspicuibacillus lycopersici]MCU9614592.1 DUF1672 domain-containing protein [Perspicuibacillus lycopersici]